MDFSLSSSKDLSSFKVTRVTSSSMPPPTEFSGLFFGDYTGLAAWDSAFPLWMDTRQPDLFLCPGTGAPGVPPATCTASEANGLQANDQEIFTDSVGVKQGIAKWGAVRPGRPPPRRFTPATNSPPRLGQDLDLPVGSIHTDALPIP